MQAIAKHICVVWPIISPDDHQNWESKTGNRALAAAKHFARDEILRWFGPQCDTDWTVDWWILWPWLPKIPGTESSPSVCILWLSAAWLCFGGAGEELEQLMKRVWDLPGSSPCSRKLPCDDLWMKETAWCLGAKNEEQHIPVEIVRKNGNEGHESGMGEWTWFSLTSFLKMLNMNEVNLLFGFPAIRIKHDCARNKISDFCSFLFHIFWTCLRFLLTRESWTFAGKVTCTYRLEQLSAIPGFIGRCLEGAESSVNKNRWLVQKGGAISSIYRG